MTGPTRVNLTLFSPSQLKPNPDTASRHGSSSPNNPSIPRSGLGDDGSGSLLSTLDSDETLLQGARRLAMAFVQEQEYHNANNHWALNKIHSHHTLWQLQVKEPGQRRYKAGCLKASTSLSAFSAEEVIQFLGPNTSEELNLRMKALYGSSHVYGTLLRDLTLGRSPNLVHREEAVHERLTDREESVGIYYNLFQGRGGTYELVTLEYTLRFPPPDYMQSVLAHLKDAPYWLSAVRIVQSLDGPIDVLGVPGRRGAGQARLDLKKSGYFVYDTVDSPQGREENKKRIVRVDFVGTVEGTHLAGVQSEGLSTLASAMGCLQSALRIGRVSERLSSPSAWVSDGERICCYLCLRKFSSLRRKHHCRICGEVICAKCSRFLEAIVPPKMSPSPFRLCLRCTQREEGDLDGADRKRDRRRGWRSVSLQYQGSSKKDERLYSMGGRIGHSLATATSRAGGPQTIPEKTEDSDNQNGHAFNSASQRARRQSGYGEKKNATPSTLVDTALADVFRERKDRRKTQKKEHIYELLCDLAAEVLHCDFAAVLLLRPSSLGRVSLGNESVWAQPELSELWIKAGKQGQTPLAGEQWQEDRAFKALVREMLGSIIRAGRGREARGASAGSEREGADGQGVIIFDTLQDKRTRSSGLSRPPYSIRFLAGTHLVEDISGKRNGEIIGAICVFDGLARRSIDQDSLKIMGHLSTLANVAIEERNSAREAQQSSSSSSKKREQEKEGVKLFSSPIGHSPISDEDETALSPYNGFNLSPTPPSLIIPPSINLSPSHFSYKVDSQVFLRTPYRAFPGAIVEAKKPRREELGRRRELWRGERVIDKQVAAVSPRTQLSRLLSVCKQTQVQVMETRAAMG